MKRHALFVGVDEYADPTIKDLDFPADDASELAVVFKRLLKFDRAEPLINPAHAPDVIDAIKDMTRSLGPGDLFLFFFAGHGFRVKDNHVLVCSRDEYADLEDEYAGLPVGRLKKRLRGPWNRMLVLDACQNDIRANRGADCGVASRDLQLIHASEDCGSGAGFQIVVTACSEGEKALEVADLRHGLFTAAFLDSVTTFADARRRIDLETLRLDIGSRMGGLISKYRLSGKQEPMFTIPTDAGCIVLLDGMAPATASVQPPSGPAAPIPAPALVVCPLCGRKNEPKDTFKCRECGRGNLCLRHQDEETFLCKNCAREMETKADAVPVPASDDKCHVFAEDLNIRVNSLNDQTLNRSLQNFCDEFDHANLSLAPMVVETLTSWNPLTIASDVNIVFGDGLDKRVKFEGAHKFYAFPMPKGMRSIRIRIFSWDDQSLANGPIFDQTFPMHNGYDLIHLRLKPAFGSVKPTITLFARQP